MARQHVIMNSIHPARIDALVAEKAADGWQLAPPWPDESGVAYFTVPDGAPAGRPQPAPGGRVAPVPLRRWPVPVVLALTALAGALAGLVAR